MGKHVYDLALHEQIELPGSIIVTRVPGGWIYGMYHCGDLVNHVFVPWVEANFGESA